MNGEWKKEKPGLEAGFFYVSFRNCLMKENFSGRFSINHIVKAVPSLCADPAQNE